MKSVKKLIVFLVVLFLSVIFTSSICNAATTKTVSDEDELKNAISTVENGDTIELTADIKLKSPIEVTSKNFKINGKGHTISKDDDNWAPNGSNGTLITAGPDATIELINLSLKNSQKYGVQAYDGGHIILNGVTISNCGFGGVLVNAGTVEIKDLSLGKNGSSNNNGIEIGKGAATADASVPEIIMNGKLTSTEKENVIYVAENNPDLKKFEVKNSDDTTDKILLSGDKVVITDKNNKILYSSNDIKDVDVEGTKYVKKDTTPKTGIEENIAVAVFAMALSSVSIFMLKRKECN